MIRVVTLLLLAFLHRAGAQPPNILVLLTDDQRADALSVAGNPDLRTPSFDSLARAGVRFTGAYCMGSTHGAVCAPSRAMLLSGRSLYRVNDRLEGIRTVPELLRAAGYETFATGKWHNGRASFLRAFSAGRDIFFGGMSDHTAVPVCDLRPDGTFSPTVTKGFSSTVVADAAIAYLDDYAAGGRQAPFFAYVAFTAPHDPRTPPPFYAALYARDRVRLPLNFMPLHPFHNGWMTGRDEQLAPWPRPPAMVRSQIAEYYGMITHLDHEIGRILRRLERLGLRERTIVVLASDNGLALGSHGLMGKQNLYEHSTRVPLIVSGPGVPAHLEHDALVYLHDVAPTLLALAGRQAPRDIDGRNLLPVIAGERPRPSLFTAFGDIQRAVRESRWKLIRYPRIHHTQLFDLAADPQELNDLAGLAPYRDTVAAMMRQLAAWQEAAGDTLSLTVWPRDSMAYDATAFTRAPDRHQPPSVIRTYFPETP